MSLGKENFLRTRLVKYFQQLSPSNSPAWGIMSARQMVEHFSDAIRVASGRVTISKFFTPMSQIPRMREWLMSDRQFKQNLENPLLVDGPAPDRFNTIQAAVGDLQQELIYFFEVFERDPRLKTHNPIFGGLDFDENVQLLYKHGLHHLKQFGVMPLEV